jgi:membrane protease YdiL (CAAX protease family)
MPFPRAATAPPPTPVVELAPTTRRSLVVETWFVMAAFLLPVVTTAVAVLAEHLARVGGTARFPTYVHQPVLNMALGILLYLPVAAVVPLALLLLTRTGQPPGALGLGVPRWRLDIWPGLGLAAAAYGTEVAILLPLAPLLTDHKGLVNQVPLGHIPHYYVLWGLVIAATTSVAEEVLVNGYLLTRLDQLGWRPRPALALSLVLRTSYHVYYGLGFLLTVPFGYYVTRSFQKHRRLNRAVAAHFIYDATLITVAILASH